MNTTRWATLSLLVAAALWGCGGGGGGSSAEPPADVGGDAPDDGGPDDSGGEDVTPDAPEDAADEDAPQDASLTAPDVPPTPDWRDVSVGEASEGSLTLLTYNVAGLPQGLSSSNPEAFIPLISPLLNDYELVLAQEDFWYHEELAADAEHPYQSTPAKEEPTYIDIGDGLNRFSTLPFGGFERRGWGSCHGFDTCASDCLATKGFSVAEVVLADGVTVDVYNLHAEAGSCPEDLVARQEGFERLIAFAREHSAGRAIIIGGDFNLQVVRDPEDGVLFDLLLDELGLRDACWEVDCGDERIDRVVMRDGEGVTLTPTSWVVPPEFVTEEGEDLSDHKPVAVEIQWAAP